MQNSKLKTDLKVRCYNFSLRIIALADTLPNKKSAWIITDQLVRSATSVGANLIEARAASSRRDFTKFYEIALKSANETRYWLGLLRDSKFASEDRINKLLVEAIEISNMLGAGVLKLKNRR